MDDLPNRRTLFIIVGLLIGGAFLASSVFMGGQVSTVLSTVGAAIPDHQGGGTSDTTDGTDGNGATGEGASGPVADAAAAPVQALLIVRTGELRLEVADLAAAVRDGDAAVLRAGGYVSGSSQTASAADASAEVTYRIPSAAWDATLRSLHTLARKIDREQITTEEVTGQVVDLGARIANLRATEAALQAIMAKATKISDVLDVQDKLTTTRGEIEKAVADRQQLEDRAAYGSLDVTFHLPAVVRPAATPAPVKGWDPADDVARASGKLVRIGQTTTSIGIWLAIVGLPLAVGGGILLIAAWQVVRIGRWMARRRERALQGA